METLSHALLAGNFPRILFWTFIHSIWQAALLAILAGLLLMVTKRTRPELRYNVLVFLGSVFLMSNGVTFFYLWDSSGYMANQLNRSTAGSLLPLQINAGLFQVIHTYAHQLFLLWFLVFLIKSIQLAGAFRQIHRIRHREADLTVTDWDAHFQALKRVLKIKRTVRLWTSDSLTLPTTIGALKPLVIVPLGLFTRIPADQLEVILLHELAHIKRNDYFINSLQKIIETVYFFNPFLFWISNRIRIERENCCDDLAMRHVKDKTVLARALINVEAQQQSPVRLALNFNRGSGQLLNRVKRLALSENQTLNTMEKVLVTVSLFLLLGWWSSASRPLLRYNAYVYAAQSEQAPRLIREQIMLEGIVIESINLSYTQDTLKVARAITQDLIESGIIENKATLSYKLNNEELIVNGIRQPLLLHQRLKEKYIHEQGWSLLYTQREPPERQVTDLS